MAAAASTSEQATAAADTPVENKQLIIHCKKTTIFLDMNKYSSILQVKRAVKAFLQITPENQLLLTEEGETPFEDHKLLDDYPQHMDTTESGPGLRQTVFRVIERGEDGEFDLTEIGVPTLSARRRMKVEAARLVGGAASHPVV